MLMNKRCHKLLPLIEIKPILIMRFCKLIMKNRTDVRNRYSALNKRSPGWFSKEKKPGAVRCNSNHRGSEINAVMAPAVSTIRLVRVGIIPQ